MGCVDDLIYPLKYILWDATFKKNIPIPVGDGSLSIAIEMGALSFLWWASAGTPVYCSSSGRRQPKEDCPFSRDGKRQSK